MHNIMEKLKTDIFLKLGQKNQKKTNEKGRKRKRRIKKDTLKFSPNCVSWLS